MVFALLAATAYAKSFTDVLGESFLLINDFFKNEGYKPYSLIIDFLVFSVVFMAVYMRGVKFAFKEVSKTEKALAVILGITTAFLLIIGGYSISNLLPLLNWLLYFLLFAFVWWLLKDMKSKWSRFFLALLLTLLIILLFLALFSAASYRFSCPESALPWLPWLLALILFILFWLLLKDIKKSIGRFLLALLLTIAVVLLILFLLKTFSKDIGCPEGPFAANIFDDIGRGLGSVDFSIPEFFRSLSGPSAPTLQQIDAPSATAPGGSAAAPADPLKKMSTEQLNKMLQDSRVTTSAKQRIQNELKSRTTPQPAPAPATPAPQTAPPASAPPAQQQPAAPAQSAPATTPQTQPQTQQPAPQQTTPPSQPSAQAQPAKAEEKGLSWGWIIAIITALAGGGLGIWRYRRRMGDRYSRFWNEGGFMAGSGNPIIQKIIKEIEQTIDEVNERVEAIISAQDTKDKLVLLGENKEKLLEGLEKASIANLWTDEGRELIKQESPILHDLLELEEKLRWQLNALRLTEEKLVTNLQSWGDIIPADYSQYLTNLARRKSSDVKLMGVIELVSACDAFEKQDEASIQDLAKLMQEGKIKDLVHGKFKIVKADWDNLKKYNTKENSILALVIAKTKRQRGVLKALEKRVAEDSERKKREREETPKDSQTRKISSETAAPKPEPRNDLATVKK